MENDKKIYNGSSDLATPGHLAEVLGVQYRTLRSRIKRNNNLVWTNKHTPLPPETLADVLAFYGAGKKEAEEIAEACGVTIDIEKQSEPKPDTKPAKRQRWAGRKQKKDLVNVSNAKRVLTPTTKHPAERWAVSFLLSAAIPFAIYSYSELYAINADRGWFLYLVFVAAIFVQMEHTCVMAFRFSNVSNNIVRWVSSVLFAFSFQFTALILTINSGKHFYLLAFAIAELMINIFYYAPWGTYTRTHGTH